MLCHSTKIKGETAVFKDHHNKTLITVIHLSVSLICCEDIFVLLVESGGRNFLDWASFDATLEDLFAEPIVNERIVRQTLSLVFDILHKKL